MESGFFFLCNYSLNIWHALNRFPVTIQHSQIKLPTLCTNCFICKRKFSLLISKNHSANILQIEKYFFILVHIYYFTHISTIDIKNIHILTHKSRCEKRYVKQLDLRNSGCAIIKTHHKLKFLFLVLVFYFVKCLLNTLNYTHDTHP